MGEFYGYLTVVPPFLSYLYVLVSLSLTFCVSCLLQFCEPSGFHPPLHHLVNRLVPNNLVPRRSPPIFTLISVKWRGRRVVRGLRDVHNCTMFIVLYLRLSPFLYTRLIQVNDDEDIIVLQFLIINFNCLFLYLFY